MGHMDNWNKMAKPPAGALKKITGGRLNGKTNINPQWRYQVMTEVYGPCGIGWRFDVEKLWREDGHGGIVFAFAHIKLYVAISKGQWSEPIPGIGGSQLVESERAGLHSSDEGYKMAVTDALGAAMKMLGVAAAIYSEAWDGNKYKDEPSAAQPTKDAPPADPKSEPMVSNPQLGKIKKLRTEGAMEVKELMAFCNVRYGEGDPRNLTRKQADDLIELIPLVAQLGLTPIHLDEYPKPLPKKGQS